MNNSDPNGRPIGVTVVTDTTGQYHFDIGSLPRTPVYSNGLLISETYGPDPSGRSIRRTYSWAGGLENGSTGWVLV